MSLDEIKKRIAGNIGARPFHDLTPNLRVPPSAEQTQKIVNATADSTLHLKVLASSSVRLEKLTQRLNTLTIILIVITLIAVIPAGLEIWKYYHPEPQIVPISAHPEPWR